MPRFERHIFVCTNVRAADNPKGCCSARGSEAVREAFKKRLHERGIKGRFRANAAGCLDACEHGVSVVVYPDQVWYGGVTPADVDEIIDRHLLAGEPVDRLRIADGAFRAK